MANLYLARLSIALRSASSNSAIKSVIKGSLDVPSVPGVLANTRQEKGGTEMM
jgi:hypothetical protein